MKPTQENIREIYALAVQLAAAGHHNAQVYFYAARIQQSNIVRDIRGEFYGQTSK